MPRDLPVGNGRLLVCFDSDYRIRDVYYPHVGQEDHAQGQPFQFGVWVDGQFAWIHDQSWQKSLRYKDDTLVTHVTAQNDRLQLHLTLNDAVDYSHNVFLRRIVVENQTDTEREVRLFFHHNFSLGGISIGDTAYYDPRHRALIHYKGKTFFWMNVMSGPEIGLDSYATGTKNVGGLEGTWRDAEDGRLEGNPIAQGSVDSTGSVSVTVAGGETATVYYWMAVGSDAMEVEGIERHIRKVGPAAVLYRIQEYWRHWVRKEGFSLADLPKEIGALFNRSLLTIQTQTDHEGAILAANDNDIAQFGRDTYSYMWPRDGALVAYALSSAGYGEISRRFFNFCLRTITPQGYMMHKYNPDGSVGSSWHPWAAPDGSRQHPIQEDETALVIWALWQHFEKYWDVEFMKPFYASFIKPAAQFMSLYRDLTTGLPVPSYDLWEERHGVHAHTVATVYGGLQAAANFTEAFGEKTYTDSYRRTAAELKQAALTHMINPDTGLFSRMVTPLPDGTVRHDPTIDSATYALWYFGMLEPDDPLVIKMMETVRERLWVKTDVGGIARYENDYYHQISNNIAVVPGNPWFICTLWLAEWYIAKATSLEDLQPAKDILLWVEQRRLESGCLAEQVHPFTNAPLSVSPLTWSHATVVMTVNAYVGKYHQLQQAENAEIPTPAPIHH